MVNLDDKFESYMYLHSNKNHSLLKPLQFFITLLCSNDKFTYILLCFDFIEQSLNKCISYFIYFSYNHLFYTSVTNTVILEELITHFYPILECSWSFNFALFSYPSQNSMYKSMYYCQYLYKC